MGGLPPGVTITHEAIATDPLIEEVASARRAIVLNDADAHPRARAWLPRLGDVSGQKTPGETVIGTLLALPLRARGQFLGVMAIASRLRLAPRQLTALEELADLVALAADRDRLLSYSRTQEALAQTMVRNAPVAMALLTGADHVIALANPAFFELIGVEESALALGLPLEDVIPESSLRLSLELRLDAVYQGSEPQAMVELPVSLARGVTYWNGSTSPVIGEGGVIGGVLVAAVDVSWQVAARQRAQESADVAQERIGQMMALHATSLATASQLGADPRELLASILRRSISLLEARAGVIYARAPRRDELEVVVSQGLRADYTGARVRLGQGLAGSVARSGQGSVVADYRADPEQAGVYDDESFTAIISVPLIHHNQVVGVLDVLDDAGRRAFTDDDLWLLELFAAQAAQAMENARMFVELEAALRKQRELDRMKDDFIATASHELRTPLTGVKGFLDLLLDYPAAQADPLVAEFVRQAANSASELEEIAERLLQTSRLDTGRLGLRAAPVELAAVVEESLRAFRALESAQGGQRQIQMDVPAGLIVMADKGRLKETLDNLISNALKYSPNGGRVRVLWTPAVFEPLDGDAPEAPSDAGEPPAADERPTVILHALAAADDGALDATVDTDSDPCAPSSAGWRRRASAATMPCWSAMKVWAFQMRSAASCLAASPGWSRRASARFAARAWASTFAARRCARWVAMSGYMAASRGAAASSPSLFLTPPRLPARTSDHPGHRSHARGQAAPRLARRYALRDIPVPLDGLPHPLTIAAPADPDAPLDEMAAEQTRRAGSQAAPTSGPDASESGAAASSARATIAEGAHLPYWALLA